MGSRCDTGTAPATVTGDEFEQNHWVASHRTWEGLGGG